MHVWYMHVWSYAIWVLEREKEKEIAYVLASEKAIKSFHLPGNHPYSSESVISLYCQFYIFKT